MNTMKRTGVTLLEVVIVTAIMSIVLLALLGTMVIGQRSVNTGVAIANAIADAEKAAADIVNDLAWAKIEPLPGDGLSVAFQVPVEVNGDVLNGNDEVNWGSYSGLNGKMEYAYVASDKDEHKVNEPADDRDYNHDGDKTDIFALGRIVRRQFDGDMALVEEKPVTGPIIISGDMQGTGHTSPMFFMRGGAIIIDFYAYCEDDDGNVMAKHVQTSVVSMN